MVKIIIIGNLTADPESRLVNTSNGQQMVCNFTVAVNRMFNGQKVAEYYRVSAWNKQAENVSKYLQKGSKVCVTANSVSARPYTANSGETRASLEVTANEIEFLSGRQDNARQETGSQAQAAPPADENGFMHIPEGIQEELPFN